MHLKWDFKCLQLKQPRNLSEIVYIIHCCNSNPNACPLGKEHGKLRCDDSSSSSFFAAACVLNIDKSPSVDDTLRRYRLRCWIYRMCFSAYCCQRDAIILFAFAAVIHRMYDVYSLFDDFRALKFMNSFLLLIHFMFSFFDPNDSSYIHMVYHCCIIVSFVLLFNVTKTCNIFLVCHFYFMNFFSLFRQPTTENTSRRSFIAFVVRFWFE